MLGQNENNAMVRLKPTLGEDSVCSYISPFMINVVSQPTKCAENNPICPKRLAFQTVPYTV